MKHISYIIDTFPVVSETFILNEILALEKRGVKVDVYSLNKPPGESGHPGAKELAEKTIYLSDVFPLGSHGSRMGAALRHPIGYFRMMTCANHLPTSYQWIARACLPLAEMIKKSGCDRIHAHFAGPAAQWAMMVSKYAKIPYTVTAHRYDIFDKPLPAVGQLLTGAERCITVSNYNKQYMVSNFGVDEDHIEVIPCGVDTEKFKPNPNVQRVKGRILTVARLSPEKGLDYLIKASCQLQSEGYDFELRIIGEGGERENIERLINEYDLQDKVFLLGSQSSEVVLQNLLEAEVFVLPSLSESLGVVYLEAMSSGTPVIGTDVLGVKEVVIDDVVGYLIKPQCVDCIVDSVKLVLWGKVDLLKMGFKGRCHVSKKFSIQAQIDSLVSIWSS